MTEAMELDEAGELEEALEEYKLAVDVCLQARQAVTDTELKEKLNRVAVQALERAERLRSELDVKESRVSEAGPGVSCPGGVSTLSSGRSCLVMRSSPLHSFDKFLLKGSTMMFCKNKLKKHFEIKISLSTKMSLGNLINNLQKPNDHD